ncbi:BspA family leucine-rich repeat surface protein [Marivirga arenosa]|uniref:BspA family leucine-rich repeat surface protein n=1 Tax=Marivirga arenosa TaxID=3059076 RepID=A0AA51ZXI5_9BACT|nr:BspA family leucine-rich repeat surface protein [Marivirga sp. BKB1-2]WNB18553.1 BspA family leucine-rich repeat surface protein [Marivirga sp. BKB1-2]
MYILTPPTSFSKVSKILLSLFTLLIFQSSFLIAQDRPFITVWKTDNPGTSEDNQITIPGTGTDYLIEWEEVGNEANNNGSEIATDVHTITFPSAGTYRVKISGDFNSIRIYSQGDEDKILNIEQWGDIVWNNLDYAFYDCYNLECSATDIPNLTQTTSLNSTFRKARKFNGLIGNWDVSNIDDFYAMFSDASSFNQDLSDWELTNAIDLSFMFQHASSFNQDLSNWDVTNVEKFTNIFAISAYNHPLDKWRINSAKSLGNFFPYSYSRQNYTITLDSWAEQIDIPSDLQLRAYSLEYCISPGREFLVNQKNWTILEDKYFCGEPFTAVFNTENTGVSADNQLQLPTAGGPFILEWEDVNDPTSKGIDTTSNAVLLDLPHPGTFRIKITGDLSELKFADGGDKLKLIDLESWGDIFWQNLDSAFMGCANMVYTATDYPNLDYVNSLNYTFAGAAEFNANLRGWNIRTINNMIGMLDGTAVSEYNYEKTLEWWFNIYLVQDNVTLGAAGLNYCVSIERDSLINKKNWKFIGDNESCGRPFITTWDTRNSISNADTLLILPISNNIDENYSVHWEQIDNDLNSGDTIFMFNDPILIFDTPGIYRVSIRGEADVIRFGLNGSDERNKLISIDQWGDIKWEDLFQAFKDCDSLRYNATDIPDLSQITSLYGMFDDTYLFNGDIGNWDVSTVKDFQNMFRNANSFNQNLNNWDVSNAIRMRSMFEGAVKFNGDISDWNVAQVVDFEAFCLEAKAFDQSLNNWNISSASEMFGMLSYTGLSNENYDSTLAGWAALETAPDSIILGAQNLGFCNDSARNFLKESKAWGFSGDAYLCSEPFITIWNTNNPGSLDDNQIAIPATGGYYSVQWEEVGESTNNGLINTNGSTTITFPHPGIYQLSIRGDLEGLNFRNSDTWLTNSNKIIEIKQWGEIQWESLEAAFYKCDSLTYSATDAPDLSLINSLAYIFSGTSKFNANLNNWDVSNISDFSNMFYMASGFNYDLSTWDVSNATSMTNMLSGSGLSLQAYDLTLIAWAQLDSLKTGVDLDASGLEYCFGKRARDFLLNQKGWTISGDVENCESAFITTWNSANEGQSEPDQLIVPISGEESLVYWEDMNDNNLYGLEISNGYYHTLNLPNSGEYRIKIMNGVNRINFSDSGDKLKITEIQNWGGIQWTTFNTAFAGCENLTITASDAPDLSQVTDMTRMFYNAKTMNADISHWDVSNVTNMSDLFHGAAYFNPDLSNWDVSNVTKMSRLFASATAINLDLSDWNTSKVTDMEYMFWDADSFQGDISSWDVSNVTNMRGMFYGADSMNSEISTWNVSNVTNMTDMFREATNFNQDISEWNTANVTDISGMFYNATGFDQNLGNWDLSNASSLFEFLTNSGLSPANYDLTLEGWATNGNIPSEIALSAEGLLYCASAGYRKQLIDDYGWNIIGDETCSIAIQETMPAAEATSVEKTTEIYITFDQEIKEIDLSGITLEDINGTEISLTDIYIDSLSLNLVHIGLGSNTYQVTIPEKSIISASGKENETIEWSFTTQRILSTEDQITNSKYSVFPNPFTNQTNLTFNLNKKESVKLRVYDLKGQLVREETFKNLSSGKQSIQFERNDLPSGLYNYQIQSKSGSFGGKMLIK